MKTVGSYEAKTHLPRLLDEVDRGNHITITKHGRAIAILVPARDQPPVRGVIDALRTFRKGRKLGKRLSVRKMIGDGRA